jgi:putative hydrolase of the HAD superfamily
MSPVPPIPSSPRAFDAILVDFGGVLTTSPFAAMRTKGNLSGVGFDAVMQLVMGPYDLDTDHPWHRVERGELDLADALALITDEANRAGIEFDATQIGSFFGPSIVQEVVVERVRRLRPAGYRTALVTNNVRELGPFWRPMVPLDELFDWVIDSSEVGVRKPDPRIFALALEKVHVTAERSVFIDDWPGHVAAARSVGMTAILMADDPEPALSELDELLG